MLFAVVKILALLSGPGCVADWQLEVMSCFLEDTCLYELLLCSKLVQLFAAHPFFVFYLLLMFFELKG